MAVQNHSLILLLLLSACSHVFNPAVDINNNLSSCIKINSVNVIEEKNIPLAKIDYTAVKHLAECGCKSAINAYSSTLQMDGYDSPLISGKFVFPENSLLYLPVSTSKKMLGEYGLKLTFSCTDSD